MDNEIEKFDPSKLMDGVKDRIKATFVSLIPDDAWNKMVEDEIYSFTEGKIIVEQKWDSEKSGYVTVKRREPYKGEFNLDGTKKYDAELSPLQNMIRNMLREKITKDLTNYLGGSEYCGVWQNYGQVQISEALKKVLVDNAETMLVNFMGGMMQMAFDGMGNRIISDLQQSHY